jgi:hypothetical protein
MSPGAGPPVEDPPPTGGDADSGQDRSDVRGGGGGGGSTPSGGRSGPPEDDSDSGRPTGGGGGPGAGPAVRSPPPETVSGSTEIDVSTGAGSPGGIDNPQISGTTPREELGAQNLGGEAEPISIAGDGPLASASIPGTDADVGGVLDAGSRQFEQTITNPAADTFRQAGERDIVLGPAGAIEGSEARGQLAEDFGRAAVGAGNVPAFGAIGVRAVDEAILQSGPGAAPGSVAITGDPERTERTGEVAQTAIDEGAEFAAENPGRAGAFVAGGVAGGVGAGLAGRAAVRGGRSVASRAARSSADDVVVNEPQPGTGGTDALLDPSDIEQPASNPRPPSRTGRIRQEFDDLFADDRAQLGAGRQRQRQRPDSDDVTPDPTRRDPSREIVEGSPRDRISGDITRRTRTDLETQRGTFDPAADPIAARGGSRGTSVGSRVPRDPLDSSGAPTPGGGRGVSATVGALGVGASTAELAASEELLGNVPVFDTISDETAGIDTDAPPIETPTTDTTPDQTPDTTPQTGQRPPAIETIGATTTIGQVTPTLESGGGTSTPDGEPTDQVRPPGAGGGPGRFRTPDPDLELPDNREDERRRFDVTGSGEIVEFETRSLEEIDDDLTELFGGEDGR